MEIDRILDHDRTQGRERGGREMRQYVGGRKEVKQLNLTGGEIHATDTLMASMADRIDG